MLIFKAVLIFLVLAGIGTAATQAIFYSAGMMGDTYSVLRFAVGVVIGFVSSRVAVNYYFHRA
jgi:hypothetical protein